jgi:hypothetical protein
MESKGKNIVDFQICNKMQIQDMLFNFEIGMRILGWDQNEITNVQCKINLHKLRKKSINSTWSQNGAHLNNR